MAVGIDGQRHALGGEHLAEHLEIPRGILLGAEHAGQDGPRGIVDGDMERAALARA